MPVEVTVPVKVALRGPAWRALDRKARQQGTTVGEILSKLADVYTNTRDEPGVAYVPPKGPTHQDEKQSSGKRLSGSRKELIERAFAMIDARQHSISEVAEILEINKHTLYYHNNKRKVTS